MELMTKGQHIAITVDGWTSCAMETYHSLTIHYIDRGMDMVALGLQCNLHEGNTTAAALADSIMERVTAAGLMPVDCTTDCEPSMVAAGRLLPFAHTGCMAHRLETITSNITASDGEH